jgi:hypothetical protein
VREITVDANGMADGVIYYDAGDVERRQKAHVVVVACNGIGTPRLLLNSKSKQFPDGLANRSGLVGRNLMFHPYGMVTGIFDEPPDGLQRPDRLLHHEPGVLRDRSGARLRARLLVRDPRGFGAVSTALWGAGGAHDVGRRPPSRLCRPLRSHRWHGGDLRGSARGVQHGRRLDASLTDSNGIPAPKITYRLSENSTKMLAHAVARGARCSPRRARDGLRRRRLLPFAGWHLMGTAGWGPTEDLGGERNGPPRRPQPLYHRRASSSPPPPNPTNTIQALTLYIADTMKKNLANLFD